MLDGENGENPPEKSGCPQKIDIMIDHLIFGFMFESF
jgi:hypothetical protein